MDLRYVNNKGYLERLLTLDSSIGIRVFSSFSQEWLADSNLLPFFFSFYYPLLQATSGGSSEESGLKLALNHSKSVGLLKPNDQVVVFQKIGDSSVVKIVVFQDQLHSWS